VPEREGGARDGIASEKRLCQASDKRRFAAAEAPSDRNDVAGP